jgi:hypothetical protein
VSSSSSPPEFESAGDNKGSRAIAGVVGASVAVLPRNPWVGIASGIAAGLVAAIAAVALAAAAVFG